MRTYRFLGVIKEDLGRVGDTKVLLSSSPGSVDTRRGFCRISSHEAMSKMSEC